MDYAARLKPRINQLRAGSERHFDFVGSGSLAWLLHNRETAANAVRLIAPERNA